MNKNKPQFPYSLRFLPFFVLVSIMTAGIGSFSSCNTETPVEDSVSPGKGHANREDLKKIIEGGWVNVEYNDALMRVHSPMFAAEAGRPVQEMMFNLADIKGDTFINSTGRLNFLDGERFDVVMFDESGMIKMKIYQGASHTGQTIFVDYTFTPENDTMLMLIGSADNDTTWFRREFHKAPAKSGVAQNALEYHVNRSLFAGDWKSAAGQTVTFSAEGTVTGWDKWTWYSVEIDKYGTDVQPDVMSAYNDKMGATYVYTLDNDRLVIYEYDGQAGDGQWTRGAVVAEFTRK